MSLAALPAGALRTDAVGPTEPPQSDELKLPHILRDRPPSATLPADSPDSWDGDQEPVVELELKIWPRLLAAAVVQLTFLMLE